MLALKLGRNNCPPSPASGGNPPDPPSGPNAIKGGERDGRPERDGRAQRDGRAERNGGAERHLPSSLLKVSTLFF